MGSRENACYAPQRATVKGLLNHEKSAKMEKIFKKPLQFTRSFAIMDLI